MSTAPILTLFSNRSGIGKTSLIYHLAWMFVQLKKRVVTLDLDPQANLTAAFMEVDQLEKMGHENQPGSTIYRCVEHFTLNQKIEAPLLQKINPDLYLLPGDIALSKFEAPLQNEWPAIMGEHNLYRTLNILTAFWQVMGSAANNVQADIILVDVGSNLGSINRSAILAADFLAIPQGADLFSIQALGTLGQTLKDWRNHWKLCRDHWMDSPERTQYPEFHLPLGQMQPIGYLAQQYGVKLGRPSLPFGRWRLETPSVYREEVLGEPPIQGLKVDQDPYCLATIKHYHGLIPMGQEHRKPIFNLTPADGAIGTHAHAIRDAKKDFRDLAIKIGEKIGIQFDAN